MTERTGKKQAGSDPNDEQDQENGKSLLTPVIALAALVVGVFFSLIVILGYPFAAVYVFMKAKSIPIGPRLGYAIVWPASLLGFNDFYVRGGINVPLMFFLNRTLKKLGNPLKKLLKR